MISWICLKIIWSSLNRTHINFVKQPKPVECSTCAPGLPICKLIYSFEEPYLFSPEPV